MHNLKRANKYIRCTLASAFTSTPVPQLLNKSTRVNTVSWVTNWPFTEFPERGYYNISKGKCFTSLLVEVGIFELVVTQPFFVFLLYGLLLIFLQKALLSII